jgi:hypothetical protein
MRSCRTKLGATLLAGGLGAAVFFGAEQRAQAQINMGAEVGVAYRSSEPKLNPGFAGGVHAEYKLVPMLALGAYFLYYELSPDQAAITPSASFTTVGGRLRFTLPLPGSAFRPYAFAGLGRTGTVYPGEMNTTNMYGSPRTVDFTRRSGWFLEMPIGLGLGYQVGRIAQISADFALRPGFNFNGDAFNGPNPVDQPKMGFTVLIGAALDF